MVIGMKNVGAAFIFTVTRIFIGAEQSRRCLLVSVFCGNDKSWNGGIVRVSHLGVFVLQCSLHDIFDCALKLCVV